MRGSGSKREKEDEDPVKILETVGRWRTLGWALVALGGLWLAWLLILPVSLGRFPPWEIESPPPVPEPSTGPGNVEIAQFYTTSVHISRGDSALICYSVHHARALRLDPPVDRIWPSVHRCLSVEPAQTTTYTLWATGGDGQEVSRTCRVEVGPAQPRFVLLATSEKNLHPGEQLALCYGVQNAVSVRLDPPGTTLPALEKACLQFRPPVTTQYTLTATSAEGLTASERFNVKVQ